MTVAAYQPPAAPPAGPRVIDLEKLKDNLYVLTSSSPADRTTFSGGNVAVFITDGGVTLVDTKLAGWGQAILDKLKTITDKPVTRIINYHTHGDHTGNDNFFGVGRDRGAGDTPGEHGKWTPSKGITRVPAEEDLQRQLTLGSGKDASISITGAGRYTNGDTFVVFPALRVCCTRATCLPEGRPADLTNGGQLRRAADAQKAIAGIQDVDTIIPASPMQTPADLQMFQRFTADLLSHSVDAMKAGKSVDDAATAFKVDNYTLQERAGQSRHSVDLRRARNRNRGEVLRCYGC
jgi:hypothetical protein